MRDSVQPIKFGLRNPFKFSRSHRHPNHKMISWYTNVHEVYTPGDGSTQIHSP